MTEAQWRPPAIGHLADPGPYRIELRFARGEKSVNCEYFQLTANEEGRVIMMTSSVPVFRYRLTRWRF